MSGHLIAVSSSAASSAGIALSSHLGGVNFSVLFGAFAGAVFYVAGAADLRLWVRASYFLVSMIFGVFGAGLAGAKLAEVLGYSERPLDGLGAVLLSALAIKTLTFFNQQDPVAWLARWKGGFNGHK
ncbi:putative holin [Pantoea sp. BAV 3049]|uniref:putative holin n=1 Tax=Pantoea sp. BAV 3049 TaxID=2654188 RepID=UPI00131E7C5D|nr:putative holin [Pantoea sp. BAV 3049]